jgi:hypothetical protein
MSAERELLGRDFGYHADGLQKRADTWSISAGLLAAIAGLSAWKLVTDQTTARWAIVLTRMHRRDFGLSVVDLGFS